MKYSFVIFIICLVFFVYSVSGVHPECDKIKKLLYVCPHCCSTKNISYCLTEYRYCEDCNKMFEIKYSYRVKGIKK